MDYQKLFKQITDEYSAKILNWAVKKTGSRIDGEDLAQEVLLQVFSAITKEKKIEKIENFIWKVAHFVWCNNLRTLSKHKNSALIDESLWDGFDFVKDIIEKEAIAYELDYMRRKIADLSYIKREAMILHYLDGLSIVEVAKKLNITDSAVKWHLFDARKKMKREFDSMKKDNSYVYRPGKLILGLSGMPGPNPDTKRVNESLIRQNICLLCYNNLKTIDEISKLTGVPKPYLEFDLNWLIDREFLTLNGNKYSTTFPIIGKKHRQDIGDLYSKTRTDYIDKIINYLYNHESDIKKIGFYGSDFETEKLMWSIIMLFLSYFSRNSDIAVKLKEKNDRPIRPDGGQYYIIGNDLSDNQKLNPNGYFTPKGWSDFYGICSDICATNGEYESYYWLGLYNFKGSSYHPEIVSDTNKNSRKLWHKLFCSLIDTDFDINKLSVEDKEKLAINVQNGIVSKNNDKFKPNFIIMSKEQLTQLQEEIFVPLLKKLEPKTKELVEIISEMHSKNMPPVNKGCIDYFTYLDLWYFGIYTYIFAAQDKKLYIPPTPEAGTPLTLVLIK
ncbi:RNA polymerase sigma factor [Oceanirhabdus sp. W0125-5]|uniref:RNA polymerase sigma factor n=1 Tax=Oceanirhabdus sp. W0125-5 TaxID=2999116 RepID=UPI0022F2E473|nr:RNA polymerase sigma factor [Oceanirhabdus sp. W0125-5]WBW96507.1 RNA polymerase sigma factor [Oceanirhabdus sp. W0125-5]